MQLVVCLAHWRTPKLDSTSAADSKELIVRRKGSSSHIMLFSLGLPLLFRRARVAPEPDAIQYVPFNKVYHKALTVYIDAYRQKAVGPKAEMGHIDARFKWQSADLAANIGTGAALFIQRSVECIVARAGVTDGAAGRGNGETVPADTVAAWGVEAATAAVEGNVRLAAAVWCSQ